MKVKMDLTSALRRREVVETKPAICQMVERWPALFTEDQVCSRVLSMFLLFFDAIVQCHLHNLILMTLFRLTQFFVNI